MMSPHSWMIIPVAMKFCYLQLVISQTLYYCNLKHPPETQIECQPRYILSNFAGKDATNDFEDVGHSDSAREMMEKYYIGEIDQSTVPAKRNYTPPQQVPYNPDKTPDFIIKILQILVPLLILVLAFGVRQYTKEK